MSASPGVTPDLIGREAELAILGGWITAAKGGSGRAAVLWGDPGAGKTALLEAAIERAADFQTVRCRGVESEMELPLSALHQLLFSLRASFGRLRDDERAALDAAISLNYGGAPSLGVAMATLTLFAELAADRPLLIVADDLHWVDEASLAVLSFVARRVAHDRVLLLAATRPLHDGPGLDGERLQLSPLSRDDTAALFERQLKQPLLPSAVQAIAAATEGNPLAIIETARYVGAEAARLATVLDAPPPTSELIRRGFDERLQGLPADTRMALTLLATSLSGSADLMQAGLDHLGLPHNVFDVAETSQLVRRAAGSIEFAHPLLRAAVHHGAAPEVLRRAHAALAAGSRDRAARAWHAAAASDARDEAVAGELESVAHAFVALGGNAAAARALERSAQLSPEPEDCARRLFQAAFAARLAALTDWALELLREARRTTADAGLRLKIDVEATMLDWNEGRHAPVSNFRAVADAAFPIDPALAVDALILAANTLTMLGRVDDALEVVDQLDALPPTEDRRMRTAGRGVRGVLRVLSATDPEGGREDLLHIAREDVADPYVESGSVAEALVWIDEFGVAGEFLAALVDSAEQSGSHYSLMMVLPIEAGRCVAIGDWARAGVLIERAIRLAEVARQPLQLGLAAAKLALLRAMEGDPAVHELAHSLEHAVRTHHFVVFTPYLHNALGLYELGAGRAAEAVAQLERARDWAEPAGYAAPGLFSWPWDLTEAQLQVGDLESARATLERFRPIAERAGTARARAIVSRLDGMLASSNRFEAHFAEALEHHAATTGPFELARTQLQFGRRLRLAGQRRQAQAQIELASETFLALGARSWHRQSAVELERLGELRAPQEAAAQLTRQETIVAQHAAEGMTNKEIAVHLFLTPKTIEWHLRQIYRKLGIRSRVQLAAHLHAAPVHPAPSDSPPVRGE